MNFKEIIKEVIIEFQHQELPETKPRRTQTPINSGSIITVIGVRRSGKTYLLYNTIKQLLKNKITKEKIIYINFEDERLSLQSDELDLIVQAYYELFPENELSGCYLFFDEIQNISGWENFIRRIFDTKTKNIFITGSNSKLLSREIATSLRGRTISYELYPLSLSEYFDFKNVSKELYTKKQKAIIINLTNEFLIKGGFPELFNISENLRIKKLQEYFNTMLYRDVIERYKISQPSILKFFIKKIFAGIGKPLSVNKIYNDIRSMGYKISNNNLYSFLEYLKNIYLAQLIDEFNFSEIKQAKSNKKAYCIDTGLLSALDMSFSKNYGKLLENMVALEFMKNDIELMYFKKSSECDFIIKKSNSYHPVQVSYNIDEPDTLKREVRGLVSACKHIGQNSGTIITFDREGQIVENGTQINIVPVYKYFLEEHFLL